MPKNHFCPINLVFVVTFNIYFDSNFIKKTAEKHKNNVFLKKTGLMES